MSNPIVREFISQFNVRADGKIEVRKTTEVLLGEQVVGTQHWRCVLEPNDTRAAEVLGAEPFFLDQAQYAWANLPQA
jgi:hypothetical protein